MDKKSNRLICAILAILLVMSLVGTIPLQVSAETLDDLQNRKSEATTRKNNANKKLKELQNEQQDAIDKKLALEEQIDATKEEIEVTQQQIEAYNEMIKLKSIEVDEAQEYEKEQLTKYRVRIRAMEENGNYNILALVLNSDSFSELLSSLDDYGDVMNSDQKLYDELQFAREQLQEKKEEYIQLRNECEEKKEELQEELVELQVQVEEAEKLIEELNELIKEAEKEAKAAEAALASASASITSYLSSYMQAKQAITSGQVSQSDTAYANYNFSVVGNGTANFIWPFPDSYRVSSTMKARWGRQHTGIDIDGYNLYGHSIVAVDGGTVILAGTSGGYGTCVIIDHNNGIFTLYAHMSGLAVSEGQAVNQGAVVGYCGHSGSATGDHLHFEVRIGSNSTSSCVNPLQYYSGYELEAGADVAS